MGFFGDLVDDILDLPGKIIEGVGDTAEKVVEFTIELPGKVVKGTVNGIKGVVEKIEDAFD